MHEQPPPSLHPTSTKVKRWPLVGRVCLLFQYYVSLHHRHRAHHRYYHYDYYYNLDGRGLHGRVRIKERRGEKRAKKERLRNEGWRRKGRRRGQRFPSTAIHDLISLGSGSAETFPGMRIRSQEEEEDGEWQRRGGERDEQRAKTTTGAVFYKEPVGGVPTRGGKTLPSAVFPIIPHFAGAMRLAIPFVFLFIYFPY